VLLGDLYVLSFLLMLLVQPTGDVLDAGAMKLDTGMDHIIGLIPVMTCNILHAQSCITRKY
jgi:hypothetical protein